MFWKKKEKSIEIKSVDESSDNQKYFLKIVLLGDGAVGKTNIRKNYLGQGFTKDHLYLKGFIHILKYYKEGNSLDYLITGKNSIEYLDVYKEMTSRDLAKKPTYITSILSNPKKSKPEVEYIISGLLK